MPILKQEKSLKLLTSVPTLSNQKKKGKSNPSKQKKGNKKDESEINGTETEKQRKSIKAGSLRIKLRAN